MGGVGVLKIGKFSVTQIQYTTAITIEINFMGGVTVMPILDPRPPHYSPLFFRLCKPA